MNWLDRRIDRFIQRVRDTRSSIAIGPATDPAYHRWFVIPRNRFFNIYLHHFHHSDEEDLHDHRMANISVILQGSYCEQRFVSKPVAGQPLPETTIFGVQRLRPCFRLPSTPHRVVLYEAFRDRPSPVWSLFIGFPQVRNWGFWWEHGDVACWFPHEALVKSTDPTSPGYGQSRAKPT